MKLNNEKNNSQISIQQDSFINLTYENEISEKSVVNYTEKSENEKSDDEKYLEKFYENRQSFIEDAIYKKTISNRSNINRPSTIENSSINGLNVKTSFNISQDNFKNTNKLPTEVKGANINYKNVISYTDFKNPNNEKLKMKTTNKKEMDREFKRSNSTKSLSSKGKINLKLKITHNDIENITNINNKNRKITKTPQKIYKVIKEKITSPKNSTKTVNEIKQKKEFNTFRKECNKNSRDKPISINTSYKRNNMNLIINNSKSFKSDKFTEKEKLNDDVNSLKIQNENIDKYFFKPLNQDYESLVLNSIPIEDIHIEEEINDISNERSNSSVKEKNIETNKYPLMATHLSIRPSLINYDDVHNKILETAANKDSRKITIQNEVITKSNIHGEYADELNKIYVKRRASNIKKKVSSQSSEFYNKNVNWKKKILNKSNEMKLIYDDNEIRKCSFTPKISKYTNKILSKSHSYIKTSDFYEKNLEWKQKVEKFKLNENLLKERKEYEECIFHPVINKKLYELPLEKVTDDYIYQKNIIWLKKVNENKKLKDLEIQENEKIKPKHVTIYERINRSKSSKIIQNNLFTENLEEEKSVDRLKKDLISSTNSTHNFISSRMNTEDNYSLIHREREKIDSELKELKNLITSLKATLEENKILYSDDCPSANFNVSVKLINNINSPKIRTNHSIDLVKIKSSNSSSRNSNRFTVSENSNYSDKFNSLMRKYKLEKSHGETDEVKNKII